MVSLPTWIRKTLAASLMCYFQKRHKLNVKESALETAYFTGHNENSVRTYRNDFFSNKGNFTESKQGKHERWCLFNDENIRLEASMWVRENAHKKGEANMTAATFCQWVNTELLPSITLQANYPCSISLRTATQWLHLISHKKGAYVDGHERDDVASYRKVFKVTS